MTVYEAMNQLALLDLVDEWARVEILGSVLTAWLTRRVSDEEQAVLLRRGWCYVSIEDYWYYEVAA